MPFQNRVRRHDRGDAHQEAAADTLALGSGASAVIVGQPKPPSLELLLQYAVLFDEILEDLLLMAIHPTAHGQELGGGARTVRSSCPILVGP